MSAMLDIHGNINKLIQQRSNQNHLPSWLQDYRQQAISQFNQKGLPLPARNHENWRFTDVSPLTKIEFSFPDTTSETDLSAQVDKQMLPPETATQLLFFNGRLVKTNLSAEAEANEVTVLSLFSSEVISNRQVQSQFGAYSKINADPFIALNAAMVSDGAYLHVPDETILADPIHLVYYHSDQQHPYVTSPRNLIWIGKNSRVTIIERYVGLGNQTYFSNAVTEIKAHSASHINHCKIQEENTAAFHVAHTHAHLDQQCAYINTSINFGAKLARNNIRVYLGGERSTCILNGVYIARDRQLIDNHTWIDHAKPNCESHELYKGILCDKAHGVFNGKIFVHPQAQKTDAKQTNRALLLSDDAKINTKPELEIYADDVKCTHGATVGHLDEEALFYLQSRGIDRQTAHTILAIAFAAEVLEHVDAPGIVDEINRRIEGLLR
jgi:Fe-S cluster assembly protein SufD